MTLQCVRKNVTSTDGFSNPLVTEKLMSVIGNDKMIIFR